MPTLTEKFTSEEVERYATYCWDSVGPSPADTRVWRVLGGEHEYLGTMEDINEGRDPKYDVPIRNWIKTLEVP